MKIELKPCPFCGGPASAEIENNGIGCFWVICDNVKGGCGCEGPYHSSEAEAAEAWNRRAALAVQAQQGVEVKNSPHLQGHSAAGIVKRIAEVSTATGVMAGEPAIELAGQIISVLAVHPEHIDRFMAEGSELFIDGTFNPEHGSMTYRAINGSILSPSVLREKKGQQQ